MKDNIQKDPEEVWIFGFGSIIYKQGFEYQRRVDGYIKGWRRVWYQGSTDHRGTEKLPGRTVTVIPDPEGTVWGSAFLLPGDLEQQKQHLQELEHREKQYDGRERLDVYASGDDSEPALRNVLTFVATSKNVHWLGPASMESVAQQIAAATGPSGPNYEYLERLAEALWKAKVKEPELYELHARVKQIRKEMNGAENGKDAATQHLVQNGVATQ
ncbi:hypothetical protein ABBQ38_014451 [Trebouxia sp. C0009 RCD-2024]